MTARAVISPASLVGVGSASGTTTALSFLKSSRISGLSWNRGNPGCSENKLDFNSKGTRTDCRTLRIFAARKNVTSRRIQQSKGRETEAPKKLGSVGAPLDGNSRIEGDNVTGNVVLQEDQAIGQVITAQANFMRVIIQRGGTQTFLQSEGLEEPVKGELNDAQNGHASSSESEFRGLRGTDNPNFLSTSSPEKPRELLCVVRGLLKKIKRRVLVGDRVLVSSIDWVENRGVIEEVLDRSSEIVDPPVANVNYLLVVFSLEQPQIDPKVLSRFLVEAESTQIDFTLVLNKADLAEQQAVESWQARLAEWGYKPVLCSADRRIGLTDLSSLVTNKVTVILGPSGVGKSSLINAFRDQKAFVLWYESESDEARQSSILVDAVNRTATEVFDALEGFEELRVGEVSVGSGRGKHTTRHVSLLRIPIGDGLLADTPGFSQPSLAKVTRASLSQLFPEVRKKLGESESGCAFPNCLHMGEPNCAVGNDWDRYSHYLDLLDEVANRERVQKKVLGTKRESNMSCDELGAMDEFFYCDISNTDLVSAEYKMGAEGVKQAEPRLALKRHRRESRKQVNQSLEEVFREAEVLQADIEKDIVEDARG